MAKSIAKRDIKLKEIRPFPKFYLTEDSCYSEIITQEANTNFGKVQ